MRTPVTVLLIVASVLVAAGCGSSSRPASTRGTSTGGGAPSAAGGSGSSGGPAHCASVSAPAPKKAQHLAAPTLRLDPQRTYTAKLQTSCGELDIALDAKRAPKTAASFVYLARRGFFDGLTFHRIVRGFVVQGGDPQGNGQGGPGYSVVEPPAPGTRYTRGVVAMAKTQAEPAGASGSQFYVVTGPDAGLPPEYAVLGRVVRGDAVLTAMDEVPTGGPSNDTPTAPVVIEKVTIVEG
jgi:peptidyl-prolyl cis-trans isomerase B (cyclophilin B)